MNDYRIEADLKNWQEDSAAAWNKCEEYRVKLAQKEKLLMAVAGDKINLRAELAVEKAKLVATAIDCNDRYAELEDRLDAARQDAREAEAYAGKLEAKLAKAEDLVVQALFALFALAELKGDKNEKDNV